jgi:hypothetical protein
MIQNGHFPLSSHAKIIYVSLFPPSGFHFEVFTASYILLHKNPRYKFQQI